MANSGRPNDSSGSSEPVPAPPERVHWAWLDRLRAVAMVDIVSFHVAVSLQGRQEHLLWGIGLPTFLLTAIALGTASRSTPSVSAGLRKRAGRLLPPWLFWSAVYAVFVCRGQMREGESILAGFDPLMILYGTWTHLWFLPFIFLTLVLVDLVRFPLQHVRNTKVVAGAIVIATITLVVTALVRREMSPPTPFNQWLFSLPSIPLGFALGRLLWESDKRVRAIGLIATCACAIGVVVALVVSGIALDEIPVARRYALSVVLICLSVLRPGQLDVVSKTVHFATFGIYLIHPAVILLLHKISLDIMPLQLAIVYLGALALTVLIQKTKLKRFV